MCEFVAPISKGTHLIKMQMERIALPALTLSDLLEAANTQRNEVAPVQSDEATRFANGGYTLSTVLALV